MKSYLLSFLVVLESLNSFSAVQIPPPFDFTATQFGKQYYGLRAGRLYEEKPDLLRLMNDFTYLF